ERISDIIQLTDTTGRITYVSPSTKRILGFDPDEIIGKGPGDLVHPDDLDIIYGYLRKYSEGQGGESNFEARVRKKDGSYALLEFAGTPILKEGLFSGIQVVMRDITEKKAAQARIDELLHLQEEQVEIINTSPAVAFLWKAEKNWPVETVSKNISRFGYTPDDFISGRVMYSSIIHPDDLGRVAAEVEYHSMNNIDSFSQIYRIFGKDKKEYWIEDFTKIRRDSTGTITHYEGIVLDITGRKQAEMERDRLISVIRHTSELISLTTLERTIIFINDGGAEMIGVRPKDAIGKDFIQFIPDHLKENLHAEVLPALMETGRWEGDIQYRNLKTSNLVDVHAMTFVIADPVTGAPQFLANVSLDITGRKQAGEALKESEEKFRMIFESSNDPILLLEVLPNGTPGCFLDANEIAIKKLGYTKEELQSLPVSRINSPELNLKLPAILQELVTKGYATFEDEIMTKSGARLPVEAGVQLVKIRDLPVIITIARDITERRKAEAELKKYSETLEEMVTERTRELQEAQEQLVKKEKLAVLGKLAGGVGHELRNPLGAIKNAAYFLNMVLENPEPDVIETLEIMNKEVARSEDILSSLLDFARPTILTLRKVRINDVIAEAVTRNPIAENITLTCNLDATLPDIKADPDKLLQVFTNLVTNACQAMSGGGTLTIRSALEGKDRVIVSVTDTGVGISEEHMKRLFEPLFSTKAKGIGLGLVVTKAVVEAHHGSIDIRSEEGKGTTFTVTLPVGIDRGP
ncbi:MAG: PAS domain S-box protein, partial [Methanobacteriota archaeon]